MHKRIELITPSLDTIKSDYYGVFRTMTVDHRSSVLTAVDVAKDIINKYQIPTSLKDGRYFPNLERVI